MSWEQALNRHILKQIAGDRSYVAGTTYYDAGAVGQLLVDAYKVTTHVMGTDSYRVELAIDDSGRLLGECSCPYGREGNFCKHCVAVGIAKLESHDLPEAVPAITVTSIEAHLNTLSKERLVAMILEQVDVDIDLQSRIMLEIARSSPQGPDIASYKMAIYMAIATDGFIGYDEVYEYTDGIHMIMRSLEELCDSGFPSEARLLTEYALEELSGALDYTDDSSGNVGDVWYGLHELHLKATLASPGDPQELARCLFHREINSDWGIPVSWREYLPALGEDGERHFRRVAKARWAEIEQSGSGEKVATGQEQYKIAQLMISFARSEGDLAAEMTIMQRDLSSPLHYYSIAKRYLEEGDADKALAWAENGIAQFPDNPVERINDLLIELYTQRQRYPEAYAILWKRYQDRPNLTTYQAVQEYALKRAEWDTWRERCWEFLRARIERTKVSNPGALRGLGYDHNQSLPVDILLREDRYDEAWQEANAGGCSRDQWLRLAETREIDHPQDALAIFQREIIRMIEPKSDGDYSEPIRCLLRVRAIMQRIDQEDALKTYVSRLRAEFKRKRNFIKMLDGHKFPA